MKVIRIAVAVVIVIHSTIYVSGVEFNPLPHVLEKLSEIYRDVTFFTTPGYVYGTCDQSKIMASERRCSLALETDKPLRKPDKHLLLCNITLIPSSPSEKIGRDVSLYTLEGERALLKWRNEDDKDRYGIVDFSNCTAVNAKVDEMNIQSSYVASANNETIDIIVKNSKGSRCQLDDDQKACKLTLDLAGNVVEGMKEWLKMPYTFIGMVRSPIKGHLVVDYTGSSNRTLRVYSVNDDGDTDMIKEFPATDDRLENVIEISTTYQLLTVCYALDLNANVTCAQFDLDGTLKFEKTLSPSDRLHSIRVHNLQGGGFVVLTTNCYEKETRKCVPNNRSSYIWKFDAEGGFDGYIGIGGFECPGGGFTMDTVHFFISDQRSLCFSDLCPSVRCDKQLMLQVVCIAPEEFR